MTFLTDALGWFWHIWGMLYKPQTPNFCSKLQKGAICENENDDHKKPHISFYDFLWSSFSYKYIHKDDYKKSPNSQFHGFLWSSFSYIYIRMTIRSHRNWPVASYDHHFHKSPPFKITPIEQKFGVWGLYSMPHICQNHPRASVKKVIIGYLIWITNNPPDQIWAKSFMHE